MVKKSPENTTPAIVDNVEALEAKLKSMREAQAKFAEYTQEQVDKIFYEAAMAANKMCIRDSLLGTLAAGSEHGARTQAVNREQVGTGKRGRTGGTANLMRNIMELKVKEDLKAQVLKGLDDLGALSVIERHTNLKPGGMARKLVGELERTLAVAVESDDYAVAGIGL